MLAVKHSVECFVYISLLNYQLTCLCNNKGFRLLLFKSSIITDKKDIFENGVVLTGGGAELYGLDTMMEKVLGVSVTKPKNAIDAVAKGLSRIHTFIPVKKRISNKNLTAQIAKFYESKKTSQKK